MLTREGNGFDSGFGLSDDGHVGLAVDDAEQAQTDHRVIIRVQQADHAGGGGAGGLDHSVRSIVH
jgi:hypothetical protein